MSQKKEMIRMSDNSNLPIFITCDKIVVGYVAALTKTDPKMVLVNLRDMAQVAVARLQKRKNARNAWTNVVYPNLNMRFRIHAEISRDHRAMKQHSEERMKLFLESPDAVPYDHKLYNWHQHQQSYRKWEQQNPNPYANFDYRIMMVKCNYKPEDPMLTLSQEEIDTILVEDILFAGNEAEDSNNEE
jgi:hypothetical protein